MQDWDDLRYWVAVYRKGSFSDAARFLGVNETTVSRRIKKLEELLGKRLGQPSGKKGIVFSEFGEKLGRQLIEIEEAVERAVQSESNTNEPRQHLRVSAVQYLATKVLISNVPALQARHPSVDLEIVSEDRSVDLVRREADLAVRFARPYQGGQNTIAQKLGELEFGVYVHSDLAGKAGFVPWIAYESEFQFLPQAKWIQAAISQFNEHVALRVSSLEAAHACACEGIGKTYLPVNVAVADQRLSEMNAPIIDAKTSREVWMLSNRSMTGQPQIEAGKKWLRGIEW